MLNTILAGQTAYRFVHNQRLRRAWIQLAISFAIYTSGNILVFCDALIAQVNFVSTWIPNSFYLASCPFLLAGLWHFPQPFRSKEESDRFYLNTGMVLTGLGIALWYLLVYHTAENPRTPNEIILALVYLFGNFVLLFGFVIISLRHHGSNDRSTLNLLITALLSSFIGSVWYSFLSLRNGYVYGAYPDVFYTISLLSFALGAFYQLRELSRRESAEAEMINITNPVVKKIAAEIIVEQSRFSILPYLSIGIGYGVLLFVAYTYRATNDNSPLGGMVLGAAALTSFVVARQVLTVRENTRLHAEQVQNLSEKRFRSLVQNSSDAVLIVGKDLVIRYVTPSVERVFGYSPDDIIGRKFNELVHPDDIPQVLGYFKNLINKGGLSASVEWRLLNNKGEWIFVENTGNNLFEDENVRGIVVNSRNVTDRRRVEDRMLHDAFHDALTGLPNRALFLDHLKLTLSRAKRSESLLFAVLFIDLDRFKYVNDSLGHHAGDLLLIEVARRIEGCLRPSDTVARLGGDEFTILIEDIASLDEVTIIAERVRLKIFEPFDLDGREFVTTVSIGIALGSPEYNSAENVLRDADTAMYHAKVGGKAQFAIFDQDMHARVISTMETEADMRRAIERKEFFLLYQPIISTSKYTLCGFEALVRWQHPTRGIIAPDDFIPLAEETGLIIPMSLWILREVGKQCALWRESLPGAPLTVSVNISCKHFQQPDLVDQVARVLHETGLEASALKLEITESAVMENTERTAEKLKGLRALGIELSLDDFGTGYSSLSYLHRFPLDILKIDRSFVSRLEDEGEHFEIVKTIISLAKSLGMKTVAEGVETERQFIKLQNLNCDFAQGFFFSKPLPVETIDEMLDNMRESIF
ncbi:MAG: EAL domain-containing protein [Pyrinomonadaceae bacterium]